MLQNAYNLPDLVDLALKVPEPGAVNFNILYTILQTMISELGLKDMRPWCHIENPMVAKAALTKCKLKGSLHKTLSDSSIPSKTTKDDSLTRIGRSDSKISVSEVKSSRTLTPVPEETPEEQDTLDDTATEIPDTQFISAASQTDIERDELEAQDIPPPIKDDRQIRESKESPTSKTIPEDSRRQRGRREAAGWDEVTRELKAHRESIASDESDKRTTKNLKQVKAAWQYTNLESRVSATEEGLMRLTDIVDMITDKIRRAEARRKPGGPSAEELEAIEERILDLEEAKEMCDLDHERLDEIENSLREIEEDFQEIRVLGNELKKMKEDISAKADKQDMEAALALKGDLELVNTKVDQIEFETAIEELGEAIGLLGIKFQKKNDEWEERAEKFWEAIDGKMTRDIFEAARIKTEERLTALMYGLKTLKNVVEELLYPLSSGVTRCIACRRPAGKTGHACIGAGDSPKRDSSFSDEDVNEVKARLPEDIHDYLIKKKRLDGPPYCYSRDTIISVPYESSSYRSSTDESDIARGHLELAPIDKNTEFLQPDMQTDSSKHSQVVKLPSIAKSEMTMSENRKKRNQISQISSSKPENRIHHRVLNFTNKKLSDMKNTSNLKKFKPTMMLSPLHTNSSPNNSSSSSSFS